MCRSASSDDRLILRCAWKLDGLSDIYVMCETSQEHQTGLRHVAHPQAQWGLYLPGVGGVTGQGSGEQLMFRVSKLCLICATVAREQVAMIGIALSNDV